MSSRQVDATTPIVVRTDSAAATHEFTDELREARLLWDGLRPHRGRPRGDPPLRERAWAPATGQDGEVREGAWVAEITDAVGLGRWPEGSRLLVRRERRHAAAQPGFTDHDGHRFRPR